MSQMGCYLTCKYKTIPVLNNQTTNTVHPYGWFSLSLSFNSRAENMKGKSVESTKVLREQGVLYPLEILLHLLMMAPQRIQPTQGVVGGHCV